MTSQILENMKYTLLTEVYHVIAGFFASLLTYVITQNIYLSLTTLAFSFIVDTDHLFEYFLSEGFNFTNFKQKVLSGHTFEKIEKIYVLLHAWEYALILLALYFYFSSPIFLAISLGLFAHYIVDTLTNEVVPYAYFIFYRLAVNFNLYKIGTHHKNI